MNTKFYFIYKIASAALLTHCDQSKINAIPGNIFLNTLKNDICFGSNLTEHCFRLKMNCNYLCLQDTNISNASVFLCFLNKLSTTRSNIRITRTPFRGSFYFSHNDVIEWKHFPRCGPFVRGIQRSPVNSSHKGQWRGALMFSLICAWTDSWENNGDADDWHAIAHIMAPL